jgi:hypothetical protein
LVATSFVGCLTVFPGRQRVRAPLHPNKQIYVKSIQEFAKYYEYWSMGQLELSYMMTDGMVIKIQYFPQQSYSASLKKKRSTLGDRLGNYPCRRSTHNYQAML